MKFSITILVLLLSPVFVAGSPFSYFCATPDGDIWTFEIKTDSSDLWNSTEDKSIPISVDKAKNLAIRYMENVPLGETMDRWELTSISIKKIARAPECWIYLVHFDAFPNVSAWNGPLPWFEVPLRMDGSIPKPKIELREK